MKKLILTLLLTVVVANSSSFAQLKETAQLATLTPTYFVVTADMKNYKKMHYTLSTIGYLSSYMITDSIWKSALITLTLGVMKELVYDTMLGRGEPLWEDMKWNALGTAQGVVFTVSLRI